MTNFKIVSPEPYEPSKTFETVVRARNLNHAKKYLRWLNSLYGLKLTGWPTNEDEKYTADKF